MYSGMPPAPDPFALSTSVTAGHHPATTQETPPETEDDGVHLGFFTSQYRLIRYVCPPLLHVPGGSTRQRLPLPQFLTGHCHWQTVISTHD